MPDVSTALWTQDRPKLYLRYMPGGSMDTVVMAFVEDDRDTTTVHLSLEQMKFLAATLPNLLDRAIGTPNDTAEVTLPSSEV